MVSLLSPKALVQAVEACKNRAGDITSSKLSEQLGWKDAAVLVVVAQVAGGSQDPPSQGSWCTAPELFPNPLQSCCSRRDHSTWKANVSESK